MITNTLALHGGTPVRATPFPSKLLGASLVGEEELAELTEVVTQKNLFRHYGFSTPTKTIRLEDEVKQFLGVKYALAVSSGTAALSTALAALGIGIGDEVILPSFGWYSNYTSIIYAGATPIFAGIDDTLNLDPAELERRITPNTKAVIIVHYQGGAARMDEIMDIARHHGVKVIEDCAQAFGGMYLGQRLGTIGDIAITSFQFNKMITAGEGGLIYTNDERYFVRAVRYHDLGLVRPVFLEQLADKSLADDSEAFPGLQQRMGELQGAVLLAQIRKLPRLLETCQEFHRTVTDAVQGSKLFSLRPTPHGDCGITLFMQFKSPQAATAFSKAVQAEGIPIGPSSGCVNLLDKALIRSKSMVKDDHPPYGQAYRGSLNDDQVETISMQTSEKIARYVGIGIGPLYSSDDVRDIITAIRKVEQLL